MDDTLIKDYVTHHAVERYMERVENVSPKVARERLSTKVIELAIKAGFPAVKLPTGHRAIIKDSKVVTVVPKPSLWRKRAMS